MSTSIQEHSYERKAAVTVGITLIIMALAAFFSYSYIHGKLVVPGDASTTFNYITASYGLFKAEILGWIIILISDVVVSWALYIFLKPVHKNLSLLGACLRLIYSSLLGIAILNLLMVMLLSGHSKPSFPMEQTQALMMLCLEAFERIWSVGLVIWCASADRGLCGFKIKLHSQSDQHLGAARWYRLYYHSPKQNVSFSI